MAETAEIARRAGGRYAGLPALDAEVAALRPRERRSLIDWAESERVLDAKTSAVEGPFRWDIVPFLREPAEAIADRTIEAVTFQKCSQSGVSELWNNAVGWLVCEWPSPTIFVMPTERDTRRRIGRLRGMFERSPALLRHIGGDAKRLRGGMETELDRMFLYLAWADSAAALGDVAVRVVFLDEVDKFPERVGREGDPVSLAEKRQRTFAFPKRLAGSTPTDQYGRIHVLFRQGDRREWWARCPLCGESHVLTWNHVELDKGADGRLLEPDEYKAGGHARYVCPRCGAAWTERQRWAAVQAGRWAPHGCEVDADGQLVGEPPETDHRSYHVSALMLHPAWSTASKLAAKWAFARQQRETGDMGPLIDFFNSELGLIWQEAEAAVEARRLADHVETWAVDERAASAIPERVEDGRVGVPAGVVLITAGIDVQIDHFWLAVWGWGMGYEAWLLAAEKVDSRVVGADSAAPIDFAPIEAALTRRWRRAGGAGEPTLGVQLALIDTQYRAGEVIQFCGQMRRPACWPAAGDPRARATDAVMRSSRLESSRSATRKRLLRKAGLVFWRVNSFRCKSWLARLLSTPQVGSGYVHLPADTAERTIHQLTSEELRVQRKRNKAGRVEMRRYWVPREGRKANHLWDASYLALAAAAYLDPHKAAAARTAQAVGGRRGVMERYKR